jgi:hypothetical protein
MTTFDFSDGRLSIVDAHKRQVNLSPSEALELFQWLSESDRRTLLLRLSLQSEDSKDDEKEQIKIHLQPQHLEHLDVLRAAIPELREHAPATNVFVSPADAVSERAIELLNEFQIEYKIHPLLEDDSSIFAQG